MNLTKKTLIVLSLFIFVLSFGNIKTYAITTENTQTTNTQERDITRNEAFRYIAESILYDIPSSYKYIKLHYTDIKEGTKLYDAIQKLVYVDIIKNSKLKINPNSKLNSLYFYAIIRELTGVNLITDENKITLKNRNTNTSDILLINNILQEVRVEMDLYDEFEKDLFNNISIEELEKFRILLDVYSTILNHHYDKSSLDKNKIIYSAIEGIASGTDDKYTTFFPPIEARDFSDSMSGEFEGIGAYVDMETPGVFRIISPLSDSPALKAGLRGGDIILKVDDFEITKDVDLNTAVSKVRGKAGTKVLLTIKRGEEIFEVEVIRARVVIKDVEYEVINDEFFYIQIKMFGDKVYNQFRESLVELKSNENIKKVIIDLRNNPGGYLDSVNSMLGLFIPRGQPVAVVKYTNGEMVYRSIGYDVIDLGEYEIYILQNSGSASASEIMIGTIKDYFPNALLVGEKTFGKGSVQTIREYTDGSALKYTIAGWYTGISRTGIDKLGIKPDIEIELDLEAFRNGEDNQLDYIINNR